MANKRGERWAAQQRGDTRYVGGKPCPDCGGLEKYTASAKCVPCIHAENRVRRRKASPETRKRWAAQQKAVPVDVRRRWARKSTLKRKYGLSLPEFQAMLDAQSNTCAICYEAFTSIGGLCQPVVDHDHDTNAVRGLLCDRCNHALGHLRDNPEIARRAGLYLQGVRKYD